MPKIVHFWYDGSTKSREGETKLENLKSYEVKNSPLLRLPNMEPFRGGFR